MSEGQDFKFKVNLTHRPTHRPTLNTCPLYMYTIGISAHKYNTHSISIHRHICKWHPVLAIKTYRDWPASSVWSMFNWSYTIYAYHVQVWPHFSLLQSHSNVFVCFHEGICPWGWLFADRYICLVPASLLSAKHAVFFTFGKNSWQTYPNRKSRMKIVNIPWNIHKAVCTLNLVHD